MKRLILICFTIVGIWFFASTQAMAIHKGAGDLVCGGCHTMHNSQGGGTNTLDGNAGGSLVLLRGAVTGRQDIHKFCLQCHSDSGSAQANTLQAPQNVYPPKVHSSTATWNEDTHFTAIGAGGNFYPEITTGFVLNATAGVNGGDGSLVGRGTGHSLGLQNVTPPGGDTAIVAFSCTTCHDPHGVTATSATINLFRNLRVSATDAGTNAGVTLTAADHTSWVGGQHGTNFTGVALPGGAGVGAVAWPVTKLTPTGTPATDVTNGTNTYGGGVTVGAAGISRWCAQCHDDWHEGIAGSTNASGSDWRRHPVDNLITDGTPTSGASVTIIDTTNYVVSTTTAGQYLPVAAAAGAGRVFYKTNNATDKVMCLSCHFAHGGPYNDNLRWDYTSAVGAGTQTGKGVSSTRGCQLCHNR